MKVATIVDNLMKELKFESPWRVSEKTPVVVVPLIKENGKRTYQA